MFSHQTHDVQIKHEPISDETNGPPPNHSSFIKQEISSYFNNSILYAMGNDLLPKTKRVRSDDTEDFNALKRMRTKEGTPNFRRPWPTTVKSSALYNNTNVENTHQSYTNFSISNLINDNDLKSNEISNDKQLQKSSSSKSDKPRINHHIENINQPSNIKYSELDTKFIKKEHNDHASYFDNRSNHETRNLMSTMISEVQNDLNITNDSEDNENSFVNNHSLISEKETNIMFNNDKIEETSSPNKLNNSNLFWTVQNENTEPLKLVISKENNNIPNSKNTFNMKDNHKYLSKEEQPLEVVSNENRSVIKNHKEVFNSNTTVLKTVLSKEKITPFSKKQSDIIKTNNTLDIYDQPLDLPNKEKGTDIKQKGQLFDSNTGHFKLVDSRENKEHKSKKKSKKKEKRSLDNDKHPSEIHNKENTAVSKHEREMYNSNAEPMKLVISTDNKKHKSKKKSKRKEKDKYHLQNEQPLTVKKENEIVSNNVYKTFNSQNKYENKIKLESSSFDNTPSDASSTLQVQTPLRDITKNKFSDVSSNLQVSTPLRDITKNKPSKSIKRYSLPNMSNIQPNINDSLNKPVVDKKITQAPRVFMKKVKWKNILQKENMYTDTRVKIHKMVFCQEDGATSEVAVKAHLENLDWSSLGLLPKTMIVEEGAAMANLQGIKGVPYLCGVIIEDPPALVMSYYKGRTLGDYLEEGDTLLALRTFSRACEIVGKIHHRGWAHYDLHADNILGRVNYNNSMTVTLLNYGFCRTTSVNPHYGIYSDPEDLEGHHLPADIINQKCNGTYIDRYSLCYILEEINTQLKEVPETVDIRDASSLGLMTEQPHLRPSSSNLAQLVSKLVSKQTHDSWKFGIDD